MTSNWPDFTLASLADVLSRHVNATNDALAKMHEPTPHSVVSSALTKPALHGAYTSSYMYLGSGMDHMAATVAVLRADPVPYLSAYTLSRGVLESAARAYWLLEERLGTGTRIARALLDRMDSLWSQSVLVPPDDPRYNEMQQHLKARTNKVLRHAREAHLRVSCFGANHERRGQPQQMAKEVRPGPAHAVDHLLEWVYGKKQPWFYSHLSGFVHASIYAVAQGAEVIEDHGGGFKTLQAQVNMTRLSTTAIACAHCHARVLDLLGQASGHPVSPASPLEQVILTQQGPST